MGPCCTVRRKLVHRLRSRDLKTAAASERRVSTQAGIPTLMAILPAVVRLPSGLPASGIALLEARINSDVATLPSPKQTRHKTRYPRPCRHRRQHKTLIHGADEHTRQGPP